MPLHGTGFASLACRLETANCLLLSKGGCYKADNDALIALTPFIKPLSLLSASLLIYTNLLEARRDITGKSLPLVLSPAGDVFAQISPKVSAASDEDVLRQCMQSVGSCYYNSFTRKLRDYSLLLLSNALSKLFSFPSASLNNDYNSKSRIMSLF
jgi:hypothetical protein